MDIRKRFFTHDYVLKTSDIFATIAIGSIVYGFYAIVDGGVYLVSGEGIVPAYSFTRQSLTGVFSVLAGCSIGTISNIIRTTATGWRFHNVRRND